MEDDMTAHYQARQDCLDAIKELSVWISAPRADKEQQNEEQHQQRPTQQLSVDTTIRTVQDVIEDIRESKAGDLSIEQLEILLAYENNRKNQGGGGEFLQAYLVSLGDLGRKDIRHEPGDAGTSQSFRDAKTYLDGFGGIPYEVVSGNHDLEGLDEFESDQANVQAWLDCFEKETPQFCRYIGEKTLLLGLSTVRFRDAPHSSHEVHIDDSQLEWFVKTVQAHPAHEGWKVLVFSHAPITGSQLRVLQNVHVTNGCAWLNHCSDADRRNLFIRTVQQNPQIKLWFSGHFHLSQDFSDSLSTVGACTFVQVGVMGPASTRDGKRQTRLVRACRNRFQIYTLNHHLVPHENEQQQQQEPRDDSKRSRPSFPAGCLRLDADIDLDTGEVVRHHMDEDESTDEDESNDSTNSKANKKPKWFQAYTPREEDGCYIETSTTNNEGSIVTALPGYDNDDGIDSIVCWWHMKDGRVLGLHQGQLIEYDAETLSPLGIVLTQKDLTSHGRSSSVQGNDPNSKESERGGEGRRKHSHQKQVVVVENGTVLALVDENSPDESQRIQVVHPNDDGSYWRKYQRNKKVRQEEKAREEMAKSWLLQQIKP